MQYAAVRPPDNVIFILVGLPVAGIAAADEGLPESAGQFFPRNISPAQRQISLIGNLIPDNRFLVLIQIIRRVFHMLVKILPLHTAVRDPVLMIIIKSHTVVNGNQVSVRIRLLYRRRKLLPVLNRLRGQVILICHRPPHVAESAVAGRRIVQIQLLALCRHIGESPFVIRVQKNQVRLDSHLAQLCDARIEFLKCLYVEPEAVKIRDIQISLSVWNPI